MQQIQRVSQIAKNACWVGFYLTPIVIALFWLSHGQFFGLVNFQLYSLPLPPIVTLPLETKWVGFVVTLIPAFFFMIMLFFAARLFKKYQENEIFTLQTARCIRNIAIVLLGWQLVHPLYDILISVALTYPTGHIKMGIIFDGSNFREIILGFVLFVIGWVMVEAAKLKEEQEFTV